MTEIQFQLLYERGAAGPTITHAVLPLDAFRLEPIARLSLVALLPPPDSIGVDGTSYKISFGEFRRGVQLEWWERCPPEWSGVGVIVNELMREFEIAENCPLKSS